MKILILTGKFGMGHWSASQSLRQQLLAAGVEAVVEDFLAYAMPGVSEAFYKAFALVVSHGGKVFNTYYKITENLPSDAQPPFERLFLDRLEELLDERKPDAVIATHPLCAQLISRRKWETGSTLPLVTCITDISVHNEWITGGTDCYMVGSPDLKDALAGKGVDRDRIAVTGIPVRPEFKHTCRRSGGSESRNLLIMGGGLGLMPRKDRFYEGLNALTGVKSTIIAGNNHKLYDRLLGKYENIEVVGFTDRVYDYMARADLMLTKPGGITLFETIFSELPILAWAPFLQQEINNAHFVLRTGIGAIAEKETEDCLAAIRTTIYDDAMLAHMRHNMRALKSQLEDESLERIMSALTGARI